MRKAAICRFALFASCLFLPMRSDRAKHLSPPDTGDLAANLRTCIRKRWVVVGVCNAGAGLLVLALGVTLWFAPAFVLVLVRIRAFVLVLATSDSDQGYPCDQGYPNEY